MSGEEWKRGSDIELFDILSQAKVDSGDHEFDVQGPDRVLILGHSTRDIQWSRWSHLAPIHTKIRVFILTNQDI